MMNMKQLKYVQVLAQEGSFSRAAEELNISQPSLSQYIKKIESQIGMPLFDRSGGDVRLTDAGQIYVETGKKILDLEQQMKVRFSDIAALKRGSISVGTAPFRSADMMPIIAKRFQSLYPGIHLVVREGTTAELMEGMEHGQYDLCLTVKPPENDRYDCEKIMDEELVLAIPAADPQPAHEQIPGRRLPCVNIRVMDGKAFVMLTEAQFMQQQLEKICRKHRMKVEKAAVVKSLDAQIGMVRAGVGMALVPEGIERLSGKDDVCFYSIREPLLTREVVVLWRRDRELSQAAIALKDVMKQIEW